MKTRLQRKMDQEKKEESKILEVILERLEQRFQKFEDRFEERLRKLEQQMERITGINQEKENEGESRKEESIDKDGRSKGKKGDEKQVEGEKTKILEEREAVAKYAPAQAHINQFLKVRPFAGQMGEAPVEHLQSLGRYFSVNPMAEESKIAIACSNLTGNALSWWNSLFQQPATFEEYQREMRDSFWSEDRQELARYRIMQEKYKEGEQESFSQFFHRQVAKLRTLDACNLTENHIIRIVRHNMPMKVEQMMLGIRKASIEEAAELLNAIDMSAYDYNVPTERGKETHDTRVVKFGTEEGGSDWNPQDPKRGDGNTRSKWQYEHEEPRPPRKPNYGQGKSSSSSWQKDGK